MAAMAWGMRPPCSSRDERFLPRANRWLWPEGHEEGRASQLEEGMFQQVVERARPRKSRLPVVRENLVPEDWRRIQKQVNRSKEEKKQTVLELQYRRSQENKARARGKLDEAAVDNVEQAKSVEKSGEQVQHIVYGDGGRKFRQSFYFGE